MRHKLSVRVAYALVTSGITLGLLGFLIMLADIIINAKSGATSSVNYINIKLRSPDNYADSNGNVVLVKSTGKIRPYEKYELNEKGDTIHRSWGTEHVMDTIKVFPKLGFPLFRPQTRVEIPLSSLRKGYLFQYLFLQGRVVMVWLLWLFLAYQLFLVLFDLRRDIFFVPDNIRRMRKMGYSLLLIAFLFIPDFNYEGYQTLEKSMILEYRLSIHFFDPIFLLYVIIAFIMLVLAFIFKEGSQLKQENELTV